MGPLNKPKKIQKVAGKQTFKKLPVSIYKGAVRNLLPDRNHPLDANGFLLYSLAAVCNEDVFWLKAVDPTMDSAVWVCCRSGSGSREMWTHSGMVTVPPSKSAMITSNWKTTYPHVQLQQNTQADLKSIYHLHQGLLVTEWWDACVTAGRSWGISVWWETIRTQLDIYLRCSSVFFLSSWCADCNYWYHNLQSLYRDWS